MLSDTLFDARMEIERYQKEYPDMYRKYHDQLSDIKKKMESIQIELDTLSSQDESE